MTVRELKDILEDYDENLTVVMKGENTRYVSSIDDYGKRNVSGFWGSDSEYLVLMSQSQVGSL
jgi:hypothetical protein